jgi:hypothetical protein
MLAIVFSGHDLSCLVKSPVHRALSGILGIQKIIFIRVVYDVLIDPKHSTCATGLGEEKKLYNCFLGWRK